MRILLAEDDELLGSGIRAGLAQHGFQVDWVRDGVAAERELATGACQAAVLDLGLPRHSNSPPGFAPFDSKVRTIPQMACVCWCPTISC